ncbi:MAG: hypothetical protein PHP44_08270 [Kiritimatiellae bacterium]|nr:hypothetical protein [Kiritimatiellia bacterium]
MDEEEKQKIREAREQEDLDRFRARVKEREAQLGAVKRRWDTSRNVSNRRNMLLLIFALLLSGGAWAVARFLASGYFRQMIGAGE